MLLAGGGGVSMGGDNDGIVHVNSAYHDKACPAREGDQTPNLKKSKVSNSKNCLRIPDHSATDIFKFGNIFFTNIYSIRINSFV